jgi:oxaloacetate decarboxylase (Na+ extruding) subunit alpha
MTEIRFADTTIRDGHLSLWAQNMRTGMMLAIARDLDRAGFTSIECMYTHPKKAVRELKEDPWERIRLLRERITETPLRTIVGRFPQFDLSPPWLLEMRLRCEARAGIRQARISDEWNQAAMWAWKIRAARDVGIDPIVNLIYSHSPKHTDAYYAERAAQLAALQPFRICLKDPGGLLTPERVRTLAPAVLAAAGDVHVELHSHCTTGLGPLNAIEAVKLGIRTINVGVPPLANGAALPSVLNVADNLRALGYAPVFDEGAVRRVAETLTAIAAREGLPMGRPVEYDAAQYQHQVPGGMLTNLRHQLKLVGMEDRYAETLAEAGRVREEWGWPIMVTPLSQFVGSQAAINVITGERYKEVTDQTILYALGYWGGDEATQGMDPAVRDKILARPRAREIIASPQREPTVEELRARFGGPGVSEEELLLRMECSEAELAALRAAGPPRRYESLDATSPLVALVRQLTQSGDRRYVRVQRGALSLTLARGGATEAPSAAEGTPRGFQDGIPAAAR